MMSSINSNKKRKIDEHQPEYHHHQSVKQEENNRDEFLPLVISYHPQHDHQQHLVSSTSDDITPQGGTGAGSSWYHRICNVKKEEQEQEEEEEEEEDIIAVAEREYERLTRIAEQNHTFLEMEEQLEEEENTTSTTPTNEQGGMMTITMTEEDEIKEVEVASLAPVDNRPNKRSRVAEPNTSSSSSTTKESRDKQRGGRIAGDESSFDELMMEKLREYKKQHGTTDVSYIDGIDSSLYDWVCSLKEKARKGTLPLHHESELKDLGFCASTQSSVLPSAPSKDHAFEVWMNRLREYKKRHGTAEVSQSIDRQLWNWVYDQKLKYMRKGNLPKECVSMLPKEYASMLEDEGVDLKYRRRPHHDKNRKFDKWVNRLREYKKQHGTAANVSRNIDRPLYCWLYRQKVEYRDETLSKEHASVLKDELVDVKCRRKKKKLIFEEQIEKLRDY